ncbi:MAG: hypothetical protein LBM26_04600, partial [Methanobrevibacter sp.]|nr:hypothetical protein [Methanobrevibacter sp.]
VIIMIEVPLPEKLIKEFETKNLSFQGFNENTLKLEFKECGLLSRINKSQKDHVKGKGIIVDEDGFDKVFGL